MSVSEEFFVPSIKKSAVPDEVQTEIPSGAPLDEVDTKSVKSDLDKSVLSEVVIEMDDEEDEEKVNFDEENPFAGPKNNPNKEENKDEQKEEVKEESKNETDGEVKEESKNETEGEVKEEVKNETEGEETDELPTSHFLADVTGEHISYLGSVCTMMMGLMCGCNPFMLLCNYFMFHVKTKNSKTKKYVNRITYCSFFAGLIGLILWIGLLIGFTIIVLKKNDIMN